MVKILTVCIILKKKHVPEPLLIQLHLYILQSPVQVFSEQLLLQTTSGWLLQNFEVTESTFVCNLIFILGILFKIR